MPEVSTTSNEVKTEPVNTAPVETVETKEAEVNTRLLEESKKYKKAYQETKAKLEESEKSKLQEKEQYKDLWQKSEDKYKTLYTSLIKEKVKAAVIEKASKAGCLSVDDLLKLGNTNLLQVDEDSLEVLGADSFVEDAKKSKPYLFQTTKTHSVNGAAPGGVVTKHKPTLNEVARLKDVDPVKQAAWAKAFGKS